MPRTKRPLAESHPNEQPVAKRSTSNAKMPGKTDASRTRSDIKTTFVQTPFEGKYEYLCFDTPSWARENDEDDDEDDDDDDDDDGQVSEVDNEEDDSGKPEKKIWERPAAEYPDHKWVFMRATMEMLSDNIKETMQRDPDNFGMYVYNDFFNYAVMELVESLCKSISSALGKNEVHQAWAAVACLAQFLTHGSHGGRWMHADDGDSVGVLSEVVSCALLACLNAVERVNELKADSKFRDLGIVMALFLSWVSDAQSRGIEADPGNIDIKETVAGYAMKAEIDLTTVGVAGMEDVLEDVDGTALKGNATATRWGYTKLCDDYMRTHRCDAPLMGGNSFNIMKWTRADRARYAFDREDPLKDISDKDIKSGNLMLA